MLLSLLGVPREDKSLHRGAEMALAVSSLPERAKVFRKLRRGSDLEKTRPDYQDVLMDLTLWIWLRKGEDTANPPLVERIPAALAHPETFVRFGGLSLGESSYLVDTLQIVPEVRQPLIFLQRNDAGFYNLPVWVDHVEMAKTRCKRFQLSELMPVSDGLQSAWCQIGG
jgi:CRISPR-associated protein Cas5t